MFPSWFCADAVLHHCLALGYAANWIVKHLSLRIDFALGPRSHQLNLDCGGYQTEQENKRQQRNKAAQSRRLKSTASALVKGARLANLLGGGRRASRMSFMAKASANGSNGSGEGGGGGGGGRRSSLRGSIRLSFMHADSKHGDGTKETMFKLSNFRCCIVNSQTTRSGPFAALSGDALVEHAVEMSYSLLTRKRKFSQSKVVSLAWRTYLHLAHACDLDMRVKHVMLVENMHTHYPPKE
jgi:hypothetical protein